LRGGRGAGGDVWREGGRTLEQWVLRPHEFPSSFCTAVAPTFALRAATSPVIAMEDEDTRTLIRAPRLRAQ